MRSTSRLDSLLTSGGFSLHRAIGWATGLGFVGQAVVLGLASALVLGVGAWADGGFYLQGPGIGFIEHPAIWTFLAMQVFLPLSIRSSLTRLARSRKALKKITGGEAFDQSISTPLVQFVRFLTVEGRAVAALLFLGGLANFVWNSYQNQRPEIVGPYEFWDSIHFPISYWLTRLYKLYLFVWLFPYVGLIHAGVVACVLRALRRARTAGRVQLEPFSSDGAGGLGFVPSLVTTPVVWTLALSALATVGAFVVHRELDATPLMGVASVLATVVVAYGLPIGYLRVDLAALKRQAIDRLRHAQQRCYEELMNADRIDAVHLKSASDTLDYFDRLCSRVEAISTYPHFRRVAASALPALIPGMFSLSVKIYELAAPIIQRVRS